MSTQTIAESERSISALRWVLALVGAAIALGSRYGAEHGKGWIWAIALAAAMLGIAAALSKAASLLERVGLRGSIGAVVLQMLDVAAALGLTWVVSGVLEDAAWALLTIPVVVASIRLNAAGVLGVWFVTSLGYIAMLWTDLMSPGRSAIDTSIVLERPGALLAIAAGIALMTRWLQAGWADQSRLTLEAEIRFEQVRTIERAGREMRSQTQEQVLAACLRHVVELGFDAATASGPASELLAVGDGSLVPADGTIDAPPSGAVELTEWQGPDTCVYSAAMLEPLSGLVISGWSTEPPGTSQADALADLVAQTTSSVELAALLADAQFDADHDALTGLANRARFERELRGVTAQHTAVAMLYMDLDHFKRINDTHGHDAGDWALRAVADVLRSTVGADCLAARHGGDEFVALLAGVDEAAAEDVARRVLAAVAAIPTDSSVASRAIDIGISIGVAWAMGPVDPDALRRTADEALFDAKRLGRGTTATRQLAPGAQRAEPVATLLESRSTSGFPAPAIQQPVTHDEGLDAPASVPLVPPTADGPSLGAPTAPPVLPSTHQQPATVSAFAPPTPDSRVEPSDAHLVLTSESR